MTSKVMVKIPPVASFNQMQNKSKNGYTNEVITVNKSDSTSLKSDDSPTKSTNENRIAQLEQNIRFLQEQHHLMLTGLYSEVESLRNKNRDLQFQLVFAKGSIPSTPSSPEDESQKHKIYSSPKPPNIQPLQVELLEKELNELKLQFQDIEKRNVYLSAIVDEQKKKLERYERDREREYERSTQPDPELIRKLEEAESLIRRLRRENSDLRKENQPGYSPREQTHQNHHYNRDRENYSYNAPRGNPGRGNRRGGNSYRGNWFPPLHSHNYWQQGPAPNSPHSNGRTNDMPDSEEAAMLPHLATHNGSGGPKPAQYNSYQRNGNKKYSRGHHNKKTS